MRAEDPTAALIQRSSTVDLVLVGLSRREGCQNTPGEFALKVVRGTPAARLLMGRRTARVKRWPTSSSLPAAGGEANGTAPIPRDRPW